MFSQSSSGSPCWSLGWSDTSDFHTRRHIATSSEATVSSASTSRRRSSKRNGIAPTAAVVSSVGFTRYELGRLVDGPQRCFHH